MEPDVSFGDDNSLVGALIVAGAAVGGIVAGYVVKTIFGNRAAEQAVAKADRLEKILIASGVIQSTQPIQSAAATAQA